MAGLTEASAGSLRKRISIGLGHALAARETGAMVTAEKHLAAGGMESQVAREVTRNCPVPVKMVAIEDTYVESGKPEELLEKYSLTAEHIAAAAEAISLKK